MDATTTGFVIDLAFFIIFALLGTVISLRLRQPYVVGLLVFGMLAGPNILGLVTNQGLIQAFTDIGSILLLFTVGIEFSISRILKSGFRALFITTIKMSVLFIVGYEAALHMGLGTSTALYVGAMIAITSTALLFKIVGEKGMDGNAVLPLLFSMLIIEDLFAVAALAFFSSLGGSGTYEGEVASLALSLGLLGVFYVLARKQVAALIYRLTSTLNQDVMILVSFSLCLVMSLFAGFIGLSPAIGAFLAGSIISSLPNSRSIEKTLKPLLLLFASLFFLSLGMQIDVQSVLTHWDAALLLVGLFVSVCFVSVFLLLYLTGANTRNSLFGASAMVVLGEFSLIIAAQAGGATGSFLIAVGSMGVFATAIIMSFLLDRQEKLLELGVRSVPYSLKFAAGSLSIYFTGLVRDFSPNGNFWRVVLASWANVRGKIGTIAVIAIAMVAARFLIAISGLPSPEMSQLRTIILIFGAFPTLYYLYGIIRNLLPVLGALSRTIARHRGRSNAEKLILVDLGAALLFIFLAAIADDTVSFLQLPPVFGFADEVAFFIALLFFLDIARHAGKLRTLGRLQLARARRKREELLRRIEERERERVERLERLVGR